MRMGTPESPLPPDLESAFFTVKGADKEGALLYILQDLVKMPLGVPAQEGNADGKPVKTEET